MRSENKHLESNVLDAEQKGAARSRLSFAQIHSFGEVLSLANDAVLCVDASGRIAFCNEAASVLLGWSCAEAAGMPFDELLPDQYRQEKQPTENAFEPHPAIRIVSGNRFTMPLMKRGGRAFQAEASVGRATIGLETVLIFVIRDVSGRRKAEDTAHLEAERLRTLVKNAPVMLAHQDRSLRYTWMHWPDAPLAVERAVGNTDAALFQPEEARRLAELKLQALHAAQGVRAEVRTTVDGVSRLQDLTIEPLVGIDGRIAGITCAAWDVTRPKHAERICSVLSTVVRSVIEADKHEQVAGDIAGALVPGLADCCLLELVVEDGPRHVTAAHSQEAKSGWAEEMGHVRLQDGRGLGWAALESGKPTLLADVTEAYLQSVAQDDTHLRLLRELAPRAIIAVPLHARKRPLGVAVLVASAPGRTFTGEDLSTAEDIAPWIAVAVENARLQRAARSALEDRDETLGIVAHDLRTPLGVIENSARAIGLRLRHGIAALSELGLTLPDPAERVFHDLRRGGTTGIEQILRSSEHASRLVRDLLETQRKGEGHFPIERRKVRLERLVSEVIAMQRVAVPSHPFGLEVRGQYAMPKVWCDRRRIAQVLHNLLDNAAKFSPEGSPIVVELSAQERQLVVSVADQGRGIAAENLQHVFERFWHGANSRRDSTGLGLAICKEILEAHGGRIWAESAPGEGSRFLFTLPAVDDDHARAAGLSDEAAGPPLEPPGP